MTGRQHENTGRQAKQQVASRKENDDTNLHTKYVEAYSLIEIVQGGRSCEQGRDSGFGLSTTISKATLTRVSPMCSDSIIWVNSPAEAITCMPCCQTENQGWYSQCLPIM